MPGENCDKDIRGSRVITAWFSQGQIPERTCDTHVLVNWDSSTGLVATEFCPESDIMQVAFVKAPGREFTSENLAITDARYTADLNSSYPAPTGNKGDPYYLSVMPEGVFTGYTVDVEIPSNAYCFSKKTSLL